MLLVCTFVRQQPYWLVTVHFAEPLKLLWTMLWLLVRVSFVCFHDTESLWGWKISCLFSFGCASFKKRRKLFGAELHFYLHSQSFLSFCWCISDVVDRFYHLRIVAHSLPLLVLLFLRFAYTFEKFFFWRHLVPQYLFFHFSILEVKNFHFQLVLIWHLLLGTFSFSFFFSLFSLFFSFFFFWRENKYKWVGGGDNLQILRALSERSE